MDSKIIFAFMMFMVAGFAMAKLDEYGNDYPETAAEPAKEQNDVSKTSKAKKEDDESPKMMPVEDPDSETTSLVQSDPNDPDFIKNKGLCHHGVGSWYRPGTHTRCGCLRCTCRPGGNWDCSYHFAYCAYYYCGNVIYNPHSSVCCCGKVYAKKSNWNCCGYFHYDSRTSKCCNYYSVKPKRMNCPRFTIG